MKGTEITEKQKRYNLLSWSKQGAIAPKAIEKADGIYLYDYAGNRMADMSSQLVNMNAGHNCRPIIEAIKAQADVYCYMSPSYGVEPRALLVEKIISLMPDNMGKVFFTNAGADANDNAIKIAHMYTGGNKVLYRYPNYYGHIFRAGNLTG